MNSVPELIQEVQSAGGRFIIDGGRLGIVPASAAAPVMEELRQYKAELMAELARRPAVPAGVRLVSWSPKAAPVQLSQCATVMDTEKFIRTTLMQLAARLSGKDWLDGGWGLLGLLARLKACGCIVAFDVPKKALQGPLPNNPPSAACKYIGEASVWPSPDTLTASSLLS